MWLDGTMPTLTVRRERAWTDRWRRYRILVDGVEVGHLRQGEALSVTVEPGPHELQARIDWCGSRPLVVDCRAHDVEVTVRGALRGWRMLFAAATVRRRPDEYLVLEPRDLAGGEQR